MTDVPPPDDCIKMWDGKYYAVDDVERSAPGLVAYVRENPEYRTNFVRHQGWYRWQILLKAILGVAAFYGLFGFLKMFVANAGVRPQDAETVFSIVIGTGVIGFLLWSFQKQQHQHQDIRIYEGEIRESFLLVERKLKLSRCVWHRIHRRVDEFLAHGPVYRLLPEAEDSILIVDDSGGRLEEFFIVAGIRRYIRPNFTTAALIFASYVVLSLSAWTAIGLLL